MSITERTVGDVLRDWRQRRHDSQLDLANRAEVSSRRPSFLETGRSRTSRELLLRLADCLDVPRRERNALLLAGVADHPLQPPVKVMRLCFHPVGIAARIVNGATLSSHLVARLQHEIGVSGDPVLQNVLTETCGYPLAGEAPVPRRARPGVAVPFVFQSDVGELSFISTTTVFGAATDVTLNELAVESFFPANPETRDRLRLMDGVR